MTAAWRRGDTGGPHRCRKGPPWTPRDFLLCEHGPKVAEPIATAVGSSLVVLVVEDDGLLVAGTDKAVTPGDVVEQCGRLLAVAEPTGDAALLVSLDAGFDGGDEAVRRAA